MILPAIHCRNGGKLEIIAPETRISAIKVDENDALCDQLVVQSQPYEVQILQATQQERKGLNTKRVAHINTT